MDHPTLIDAKTGEVVMRGSDHLAITFYDRLLEGDPAFWALALKHLPGTFIPDAGEGEQTDEPLLLPASLEERRERLATVMRILRDARFLIDETPPPRPNGGGNGETTG